MNNVWYGALNTISGFPMVPVCMPVRLSEYVTVIWLKLQAKGKRSVTFAEYCRQLFWWLEDTREQWRRNEQYMESKVLSTGNLQVTSGLMLLQVYLYSVIFQDILTTPVTVFGHWMLHYDTTWLFWDIVAP